MKLRGGGRVVARNATLLCFVVFFSSIISLANATEEGSNNDAALNNEEVTRQMSAVVIRESIKGVVSTNVQDLFPRPSINKRDERLSACNCTGSQQCCYHSDIPFCCPREYQRCCGDTCCSTGGICCRSKTGVGASTCCPSGSTCTTGGECVNFFMGRAWYHVPFTLGILIFAIVSCGVSCICYSRMQQRRRRVLAAQLALRLATMNPAFEEEQRTGVPEHVIDSLPIQQFKKGCMPAENATCSICLNDYEEDEELRTLPCTHLFHTSCIDRWLAKHITCPLCIQPVSGQES